MARSVLSIALAVLCVIQYVSACDEKTIEKVKALKAVADPESFLKETQGKWQFTFVATDDSDDLSDTCLSATLTDGKVEFSGFVDGEFDVKYDNDKMVFSSDGNDEWKAYVVGYNKDTLALVSCSATDVDSESVPFSGVAVREGVTSLQASKEFVDKIKELGINGYEISPCEE